MSGGESVGADARPGWVYCISNPTMPGLVKIGTTSNSVEARMRQLDTTGVARPFEIVEAWLSPDARGDEARAHNILDRYRVRENREWFRIDERTVRRKLAPLFDGSRARWTTSQPRGDLRAYVDGFVRTLGWISLVLLTMIAIALVLQR